MRIIISGGAGFIGSFVVERALEIGYEVLNIDSLTYAGSRALPSSIISNDRYSFSKVDIRESSKLLTEFKNFEPDYVIHLAAETHVDRSILDPQIFLQTNIIGTMNMLEAAYSVWPTKNKNGRNVFLHVSTDEVYGTLPLSGGIPFNEKNSLFSSQFLRSV